MRAKQMAVFRRLVTKVAAGESKASERRRVRRLSRKLTQAEVDDFGRRRGGERELEVALKRALSVRASPPQPKRRSAGSYSPGAIARARAAAAGLLATLSSSCVAPAQHAADAPDHGVPAWRVVLIVAAFVVGLSLGLFSPYNCRRRVR